MDICVMNLCGLVIIQHFLPDPIGGGVLTVVVCLVAHSGHPPDVEGHNCPHGCQNEEHL